MGHPDAQARRVMTSGGGAQTLRKNPMAGAAESKACEAKTCIVREPAEFAMDSFDQKGY
jgi:hypothetical protein